MPNPRKPTILKVVTGTTRPDRTNLNEPQPEITIPSCPAGLSAAAKSEWRRVAPMLEEQGLLSGMDRAALAGYCELYARWMKALREIQKTGEVINTAFGPKTSPWLTVARAAEKEMRMFANEFGMTPASRSKVDATPVDKKKPEGKDRFFK